VTDDALLTKCATSSPTVHSGSDEGLANVDSSSCATYPTSARHCADKGGRIAGNAGRRATTA
jgi:hypothetical protein